MSDIKTIYSNTSNEKVLIKVDDGYCIIHVDDEFDDSAEICIPVQYAMHVGESIIDECNEYLNKK